jgi:hypothetical protein
VFPEELIEEIKNTFLFWYESGEEFGMLQYTKENCDKAESIVLNLVSELTKLGVECSEQIKLTAFKSSVQAMNNLNRAVPGFIETGEREALCEIYDEIAKSVKLNPENYGEGDGIASEWREW